jgi:hypothetical protein
MLAEGLKIVIVDDDKTLSGGGLWDQEIRKLGGEAVLLSSTTVPEFLKELRTLIAADTFDGTILDIIFPGDAQGGITLWKSLSEEERRRLGQLMVQTKLSKNGPVPVAKFVQEFGVLRLSNNVVRDDRLAILRLFINDIRVRIGDPKAGAAGHLEERLSAIENRLEMIQGRIVELESRFE